MLEGVQRFFGISAEQLALQPSHEFHVNLSDPPLVERDVSQLLQVLEQRYPGRKLSAEDTAALFKDSPYTPERLAAVGITPERLRGVAFSAVFMMEQAFTLGGAIVHEGRATLLPRYANGTLKNMVEARERARAGGE